jgi:hypothetical protein
VIGDKTVRLQRNKAGEPRPFKFRQRVRASSKSRHLRSPVLPPGAINTGHSRGCQAHACPGCRGNPVDFLLLAMVQTADARSHRGNPLAFSGFPARSRRLPGGRRFSLAHSFRRRHGRVPKRRARQDTPGRSHGLDSLTASERRVAELAGQGHRNREVAQTSSSPHPPSRVTSRASSASSTSTRAPSFTPRLRVAHRSRRSVPTRT